MRALTSCVPCGTGDAIMHCIPIFIRVLCFSDPILLLLPLSHARHDGRWYPSQPEDEGGRIMPGSLVSRHCTGSSCLAPWSAATRALGASHCRDGLPVVLLPRQLATGDQGVDLGGAGRPATPAWPDGQHAPVGLWVVLLASLPSPAARVVFSLRSN